VQLAIASDEISFDFETAVTLGLEWGINCFELKRLSRRRIPEVEDAEIRVVEEVLAASGATLSSLSPALYKVALELDQIRRENQRLELSIALAHRLRVSRLVVFGFERCPADAESSALAQVTDVLGQAAERSRREGITLMLEDEPGFWADGPATSRKIIGDVASSALRINWDPCNSLAAGAMRPYPDGYELVKGFVEHVHAKDARVMPDGSLQYVVLGSGNVDWAGQFTALARAGYQGYCVLEPHFGNRVASSRAAAESARTLMQAAGDQRSAG
jgi:sugar phosphate isomerase/epimerase